MTQTYSVEQALFSIEQACLYLGKISRTKIYDLIKSGELQKIKIGSSSFIPRTSLDAFIDQKLIRPH